MYQDPLLSCEAVAQRAGGFMGSSTISESRIGTMNRSESPSTALRAPSPPLGEKDGMRGYGSWVAMRGVFVRAIITPGSHFRSSPIAVVHVGKDVVQPFDSPEPLFVHAGRGELFVQGDEAKQVVFDTAAGVVGTRAGAEYERPIAGLGEQQFARGLLERALRQRAGAGKFSRQFGHSLLR